MVMTTPEENGDSDQNTADSTLLLPAATDHNEISPIPKNFSTNSLLSHAQRSPALSIDTKARTRYSLDANMALELNGMAKSPIISEHAGEHGLGLSGLRRIRQLPSNLSRAPSPGRSTGPPTRASSMHNLQIPPQSRNGSIGSPSGSATPSLNTIEDLQRFPTESLHSFSFAHQSEESIDRRQNVLKRATDFFRDRLGWAASNPGLVAAQAKLSGDKDVQSMMELLARAQVIGEDAHKAHGLAGLGPMTGPADLSGENPFEKSFNLPRSESPVGLGIEESSLVSQPQRESAATQKSTAGASDISRQASITLETLTKVTTDPSIDRLIPPRPRTALKRTYTNLDDAALQSKLEATLAEPYTMADTNSESVMLPRILPTLGAQVPTVPSSAKGHSHAAPHAAAPHGHGNRWTPAAQAIFTTDANSPWTITAANDLACLVFGVTRAEVRKLGILEVVRPERRKWLEEKLKDPEGGSLKGKNGYSQSQRSSPSHTTTLNVGSGITARLLSKPPSRAVSSSASKRRAQTDDGSGGYNQQKVNGAASGQSQNKSRGVLLCGDVVPIQKRNGAVGAASLWVKEKKGGLIWVLEEIAEDTALLNIDEIGCVNTASGAVEAIWGMERIGRGMDVKRLIPDLPKLGGTHTGALDYDTLNATKTYTALTNSNINIPVTVEQSVNEPTTFRVSSFPHIAGIMVLNSATLKISSSNTVFADALFGQASPDGMHINNILPGFDRLLNLLTDEDNIEMVDGIVIPEHSFRRARALLAFREGTTDAAESMFLRPAGLPAKHRDGAEVMVDVQMRVVKSEKSAPQMGNGIIEEEEEEEKSLDRVCSRRETEVVYALWITYSRQMHAASYSNGAIIATASGSVMTPHQPSPGQSISLPTPLHLVGLDDEQKQPVSLLTQQLKGQVQPIEAEKDADPTRSRDSSDPSAEVSRKKTISDFSILEEMGQGAYGQVKLCRCKKNSNKVVIKYVTKRRILVDTWTRDRKLGTVPLEIHVLNYLRRDDLKHPNIVEMSDFFEDDTNYYIEMVPHGLPGMDLFDYIELRVNMDEIECRKIFVQVASAVWHLHIKAKVVHRDIKDENVILDGEGNIKLIDFGSAAYIKNGPFDVFVGTIDYAAPEVLAGQSYRGKEQDVWALGILLYTIIYKENPFYSIDEIMDHDLRVPYVMSEASIDLVRAMLNRDVDQRITISEVLEHRWCRNALLVGGDEGGA